MPNLSINRGTPFNATASGVGTAAAYISKSTTPNTVYITDIVGTSTTAGTWALLGGATGTTIFWAGIANTNMSFQTPITITASGTVTFYMNGATATYANLSGYTI